MTNTLESYFESKKRDLSDKSNDGDERKKAKESNLDLSLNQDDTDVFHSVKSVQIQSCFCSVLYCIRIEVNLRIQSKYRKIRTRNNSVFGHFSRSALLKVLILQDVH